MKRQPLAGYLERIKAANARRDYRTAKRVGEWCLKNLAHLGGSPNEKYLLYSRLGLTYFCLMDYSRAIEAFYKAALIVVKYHLPPENSFYASLLLGHSFIGIQASGQALRQFQKAKGYYLTYQSRFVPTEQANYFGLLIGQVYGYLFQNNLPAIREILEKELFPMLSSVTDKGFLIDYYHLKGEYETALGQYDTARQSFQQANALSDEIHSQRNGLEAETHLAMIDILTGQLETAGTLLSQIYRTARSLKLNDLICEAALLLSKYHLLQNQPARAARLEQQIKPLLKKVDVVWLYEKTRELDEFYRQLKLPKDTAPTIPKIVTQTINQHYAASAGPELVIGNSAAMRETWQLVEKIAPTDLPVLIQGETGTGKELIARALRQNSLRLSKPYLACNSGAITETLIESELFGHTKGAFTDAKENKKGYIELASGGTLFIDEISNMSPAMQQKLLRVLEEKQVWPLGGEKPIVVDTRFIFASNQDIEQMVKNKHFREDLFYRINTIVINLPPLRDRKDDILLLVQHFLGKYSPKTQDAKRITPDALALLASYPWPGNIRELENEIKRLCALYPDIKTITESMISAPIRNYIYQIPLSLSKDKTARELVDNFEKQIIQETLRRSGGNISKTAHQLGYDRRQFYRKLKYLKIPSCD